MSSIRRVAGPERVSDNLDTVTLHPTKGYRRISGRRIKAQAKMQAMGVYRP